MDTASRYVRLNIIDLSDYRVVDYWKTLQHKGLLKYRINEVPNPTLRDVREMVEDKENNMCFVMWDPMKKRVCADTMLNNFRGLCAQVHFSIHPDYHGREAIRICKEGAEQHFGLVANESGQRLTTLVGLTPANNRLAVKLIQKVGFKIVDVIENLFYNKVSNNYINGILSKLTAEKIVVVVVLLSTPYLGLN
jgi:hypothetical protein